jgi:hypothetical protein
MVMVRLLFAFCLLLSDRFVVDDRFVVFRIDLLWFGSICSFSDRFVVDRIDLLWIGSICNRWFGSICISLRERERESDMNGSDRFCMLLCSK